MQQVNIVRTEILYLSFQKSTVQFPISCLSSNSYTLLLVSSDLYLFFSDTAPLGKDEMRKIVYLMIALLALQANKVQSYNRTHIFPLNILSLTHKSESWKTHFIKHVSCVVLYSKQMTTCFFMHVPENIYQIFDNGVHNLFRRLFCGKWNLCLISGPGNSLLRVPLRVKEL